MHTFWIRSPLPTPLDPRRPASSGFTRRELLRFAAAGGGALLLGGCAQPPPPFVPMNYRDLKIVHCFDGIPHQAGSKPWILGGTCCCTPCDRITEAYHRDKLCLEYGTDDLIALYRQKDVALALDHANCNNLCEYGPHVTKGGRCMVPPTPGTRNYEEVVTGHFRTSPTA